MYDFWLESWHLNSIQKTYVILSFFIIVGLYEGSIHIIIGFYKISVFIVFFFLITGAQNWVNQNSGSMIHSHYWLLFFFFVPLHPSALHGMWDLSSLNMDWTHTPCIGNTRTPGKCPLSTTFIEGSYLAISNNVVTTPKLTNHKKS